MASLNLEEGKIGSIARPQYERLGMSHYYLTEVAGAGQSKDSQRGSQGTFAAPHSFGDTLPTNVSRADCDTSLHDATSRRAALFFWISFRAEPPHPTTLFWGIWGTSGEYFLENST